MKRRRQPQHVVRCWEFFHCREDRQKECLMPEINEWRCWTVNIACCKIDKDVPRPLSIKKVLCKTCAYYKEYHQTA